MTNKTAEPKVIRFIDAVGEWLRWQTVEGRTTATLRNYKYQLSAFTNEIGSKIALGEVGAEHIMRSLESLRSLDRSPHTVRTRYRTLRAFFTWAQEWYELDSSPFKRLRTPRVPRRGKGFVTAEQFDTLLTFYHSSTALGLRTRAMLWVLATTGMRRGELAGLSRKDLDWDRGLIRVFGKGQKERWVPFHQEAQRWVLRYMKFRGDIGEALWVGKQNRRLAPTAITHWFSTLFARAGIPAKDAVHVFRRTWAANTQRQGIPRWHAVAVGGWNSPNMLDHYTREMAEEDAAESFKNFDPKGARR